MKNAEGEDILVPEGQSKIWNYHPNLPVPNSPVFRWRPRIWFVLNWFRRVSLSGRLGSFSRLSLSSRQMFFELTPFLSLSSRVSLFSCLGLFSRLRSSSQQMFLN